MHGKAHVRLGTFLICLGLLAFEVFSTRLLSVAVGPFLVIFVIALAMLGMSFAASYLSVKPAVAARLANARWLSRFSLLLALAYILALVSLTAINGYFNAQASQAIAIGGLDSFVDFIFRNMALRITLVGFFLAVPYVLFGASLVLIFRYVGEKDFHTVYFADLFGAAVGAIGCVLFLEFWGYPATAFLVIASTVLASVAFNPSRLNKILSSSAIVAVGVLLYAPETGHLFEPRPNEQSLAGQWGQSRNVEETWHAWNSHSRVARMSIGDGAERTEIYALGDGVGWAKVPDLLSEGSFPVPDQAALAATLDPEEVLVLFAGVGNDMVGIDRLCEGECRIRGVEINRKMTRHAVDTSGALAEFFEQDHVDLVHAEAREFLEGDQDRYDAILLSWSGAGYSYYVGSSGMLSQYLYTREAYEALLDHLTDEGMLVIADGSKARSLVTFREIFEERGLDLSRAVIAVKRVNAPEGITESSQLDTLDRVFLMIKPSGFSDQDIARFSKFSDAGQHELVRSPNEVTDTYRLYEDIIGGGELESRVREFEEGRGLSLESSTDNRPFFLNLTPRWHYFSAGKLLGAGDGKETMDFTLAKSLFKLFAILGLLAVLVIVAPLGAAKGPEWNATNANHLVFFLSVGLGFMLIEVGLVQQFGLVLGNPSLAIAVVLAAIILAAGLGSLCSKTLFETGRLNFHKAVLGILAYTGMLLLFLEPLTGLLLPLAVPVKSALIILILLPLGMLMGQLFPQGLNRAHSDDENLVPWAWALNGSASMLAVGLAVFLAYPLGYKTVIVLGMGCYVLILLLPVYRTAGTSTASRQG